MLDLWMTVDSDEKPYCGVLTIRRAADGFSLRKWPWTKWRRSGENCCRFPCMMLLIAVAFT